MKKKIPLEPLIAELMELADPRVDRTKKHLLVDIIMLTVCAVLGGVDDYVHVEHYGKSKHNFLKSFLSLPNGIPSHDTIGRVMSMLDTQALCQCFSSWVKAVREQVGADVIAIDGKTLRRSFDSAGSGSAIHMVNALSTRSLLSLGQLPSKGKKNEIKTIPDLLDMLDISGCTVTTDAMGTQKAIVAKIVDKDGDYLLALKGNNGSFHSEVKQFFEDSLANGFSSQHDFHQTIDADHGRIETRRVWVSDDIGWFAEREKWVKLTSIALVEAEREVGEKKTVSWRYYISSLPANAKQIASAARSHWAVENNLHWTLDVTFAEDQCRVRAGNGAANFAALRQIAYNLLKAENSTKKSMKIKRLTCSWENDYLLKVLFG